MKAQSLITLLLLTMSTSSFACSCLKLTLREYTEQASAIFVGQLQAAEIIKDKHHSAIQGAFHISEQLKGTTDSPKVILNRSRWWRLWHTDGGR